jgi:hypothetical protein
LLIKSTSKNKKVPYHKKVINNIKKHIADIDPEFLNFNWIISGSFAVNSLYAPSKDCNDIDFYFSSQQDYLNFFNYLSNKHPQSFYSTELADTFTTLNLQLIKKFFLTPEELIYTHDFVNVSVAITLEAIYTTKETHYAWYNEQLDLRNFQIPKDSPSTSYEQVLVLNLLLNRTHKYMERYDFRLSSSYKKFLYAQKNFLQSINRSQFATETPLVLNYYGTPVDHSEQIASAISSINVLLKTDHFNSWEISII